MQNQITETHGGFSIRYRLNMATDGRAAVAHVSILDGDIEVFNFKLCIWKSAPFERDWGNDREPHDLALLQGRLWAHGLIDLDKLGPDQSQDERRAADWDPLFGETVHSDENLRWCLLKALRSMGRRQTGRGAILTLDVVGVATVLGVRPRRVSEILDELVLEGLAENAPGSGYHALAADGCCRLTVKGLEYLRNSETPATEEVAFIGVDEIDSFAKIRGVSPSDIADRLDKHGVLNVPEATVKLAIQKILGEMNPHKDWGGERSDLFTTRVLLGGKRTPTAMLLKGPGIRRATLHPAQLGLRGDQGQRLFTEAATLFVLQFNGKVDSTVNQQMEILTSFRKMQGKRTIYCVIDGTDTARLLRAYNYI